MNVQNLIESTRLVVRAEVMITEIKLLTYARKIAFTVIGILTGLMALAFINVAAFVYLQSLWGPVLTPLAVGLANFAFAALALIGASSAKPGPELAMAEELRKLSASTLESAVQGGSSGIGLLGTSSGTRNSNVAALVLPSVISIIRTIRKTRQANKGP